MDIFSMCKKKIYELLCHSEVEKEPYNSHVDLYAKWNNPRARYFLL